MCAGLQRSAEGNLSQQPPDTDAHTARHRDGSRIPRRHRGPLVSLPSPSTPAPQDAPGPALAHPPLVLRLLVVVLVVAVVTSPSGRGDHGPRLARGVVGTVFCQEQERRAWSLHSMLCFPSQEVWRQQPDVSRGGCAHPLRYPTPSPPGHGRERPTGQPPGGPWGGGVLHRLLPLQENLELRELRA